MDLFLEDIKMKIEISQRSDAWNSFRQTHIGASETAIILGESPFMSAYDLYLIKTKQKEPQKTNYAMQVGIDSELTIKSLFEQIHPELGVLTSPVFEYDLWPILSASLDGYCEKENIVVEFKKPSALIHKNALAGKVPIYYEIQVQTQMLVSGAKLGYFVTYDGGHSLGIVKVHANPEMQAKILEESKKFWKMAQDKTPPAKPPGYPEPLEENEILRDLFYRYEDVSQKIAIAQDELEIIKEHIKKRIPQSGNHYGFGYNVSWATRKGSINYEEIPMLKELDLEQYRKKSSSYLLIKKRTER